jgi:hypothetical protein
MLSAEQFTCWLKRPPRLHIFGCAPNPADQDVDYNAPRRFIIRASHYLQYTEQLNISNSCHRDCIDFLHNYSVRPD